uniref:Uncharacterized protein n=1 Tax=Anopheles atroparvus TaxID=41427 RepID=A0A182J1A3_ANOAO
MARCPKLEPTPERFIPGKLLAELQGDGEQHQHLVQPRHGALRLARVELHRALEVRQLVRHEDQLVALDVEADGEIFRQVRRQRLHVTALHQLVDRFLARDDERRATPLQRPKDVAENVQHLVGRLEVVRTVHVVDVIDRLLQVVRRVLHLLYLPRVVLGDGGPLDLLLLPLDLERDRKPVGTLDQYGVQLLQHRVHLLVQYPLEFHLL